MAQMKIKNLSDVQELTASKPRRKAISLMSLEHLANLCTQYALIFDIDSKESKTDLIKATAVYKNILKRLGGNTTELENIVKYYIPISRLIHYFKPTHNSIMFNIFFLSEALEFYLRASKTMASCGHAIDWITLKRKLDEQGEDYAEIKRPKECRERSKGKK